MRQATIVAVLSLMVAACGQVEPVIMTLAMPDCVYQGPSEMHPGEAQLTMTLNGIGEWGSALVKITGDHTYKELREHVETVSDVWGRRPDWVRPVITLSLSDADAVDGVDGRADVDKGAYAVVCLDHDGEDEITYRLSNGLEVNG